MRRSFMPDRWRVCAQDRVYDGAVIRITDETHREIAVVPVPAIGAA